MQQVLEHLGWLPHMKGSPPQLRSACPIHSSLRDNRKRTFSVHLSKNVFQCFHAECAAQGNVLDLWAALHRMALYDAAVDLARTFRIPLQEIREEEPVLLLDQPKLKA